MKSAIYLTAQDKARLLKAIVDFQRHSDKRDLPHIQELEKEVERAEIIEDSAKTPRDVITMRSRVRLRNMTTDEAMDYTVVYPTEQDAAERSISVLAPLGTAMLGYRCGDSFEVNLPKGTTQFKVEAILYQPELAGDYSL